MLFRLCLKDKKIQIFICTNIYFTPTYVTLLCLKIPVPTEYTVIIYQPLSISRR